MFFLNKNCYLICVGGKRHGALRMSHLPGPAGGGARGAVRPRVLLGLRAALRGRARQAAAALPRLHHAPACQGHEAHQNGAVGFSH